MGNMSIPSGWLIYESVHLKAKVRKKRPATDLKHSLNTELLCCCEESIGKCLQWQDAV